MTQEDLRDRLGGLMTEASATLTLGEMAHAVTQMRDALLEEIVEAGPDAMARPSASLN